MKLSLRKLLTPTIAALSLMALVGCGNDASPDSVRIGATFYGLQNEFTMRMDEAGREWAEANNINYTAFDGNYSAATQMEQFETMISQGFDAIVFNPQDIVAGAAAVERAHEAGIPVIGVNTMVQSDLIASYVGSLDVTAGEAIMRFMVDHVGREDFNIVIIEGPMGQSAQLQRMEGIQNALQDFPNINVLAYNTANWSRLEAMDLMETWLVAFPGQIDAIIAQNDEMALGARAAIEAAGLDIPAIGVDGIHDAIVAVGEGRLVASYFQNAEMQMIRSLEIAVMAANGEEVEPFYWIPFEMITIENYRDFLE